MIFEDPMTSPEPGVRLVVSPGSRSEELKTHFGMRKKEANNRAVELLDRVRIPSASKRIKDYPHQFATCASRR